MVLEAETVAALMAALLLHDLQNPAFAGNPAAAQPLEEPADEPLPAVLGDREAGPSLEEAPQHLAGRWRHLSASVRAGAISSSGSTREAAPSSAAAAGMP